MSWKHTDILENNTVQTAPNSLEEKVGDKPEKQINAGVTMRAAMLYISHGDLHLSALALPKQT